MSPRRPAPPKPVYGPRPGERAGRLRRGVGLVVVNSVGQVFAGLRAHADGHAAWQLPQGGIDPGEDPRTTAYRELQEETGLTEADVTLLAEHPRWTVYRLPETWARQTRFAGQRQRWFCFKYAGEDTPNIHKALHNEFKNLQWMDAAELEKLVIAFRQPVYRRVFQAFAAYLKK
jgi:putative (di)nucleoside polyphosphate hydrolase